jgi:hypothetical protein
MDKAMISRLENGVYENATIATFVRLASVYGKHLVLDLVPMEPSDQGS